MRTYIAEFTTRCGETLARSIVAANTRSATNKARKMLWKDTQGGGRTWKADLMEVNTIYPALLNYEN